jgi:Cu/Ag efflux pump CusA
MNTKADSIAAILKTVRGIKDLGILRNIGQPELSIVLNQRKMAAYGITIADAETVIEMAIVVKRLPVFLNKKKNSMYAFGMKAHIESLSKKFRSSRYLP